MYDRRWTDLLAAAEAFLKADADYQEKGGIRANELRAYRLGELKAAVSAANHIGHSKVLEEEERGKRAVSGAGVSTAGAAGVL